MGTTQKPPCQQGCSLPLEPLRQDPSQAGNLYVSTFILGLISLIRRLICSETGTQSKERYQEAQTAQGCWRGVLEDSFRCMKNICLCWSSLEVG